MNEFYLSPGGEEEEDIEGDDDLIVGHPDPDKEEK